MQKVNLTAIIISVVIVIGVLATVSFIFPETPESTIQSSGIAQLTVEPDRAVVYVNVQTTAQTAEDAKNKNTEITNKVLTSLNSLGISKDDIGTENYNIYPEYDYSSGNQKFKGYIATNTIKVESKDFDSIGKVVDAAVNAGALINYINFELSVEKQNEYKKTVLASAAEDARSKAEALATGAGQRLGDLVSISSSDYSYYPYPIFRAEAGVASDAKQAVTDLPARKLDVSATVIAVYEIR